MQAINEAKRYIDNAKQILKEKAHKEDGLYSDKKYVKMAGHTAYSGVLVALDAVLGEKKKGRKSVEWYQKELSAIDRKVTATFANVYDTLHLCMGYDGNQNAKIAVIGFEEAEKLITWAERRIQ